MADLISYCRADVLAFLLSYLGIMVPAPPPPGWQAFEGQGYTVHLPGDWQEIPETEEAAEAMSERCFQRADQRPWVVPVVCVRLSQESEPPSSGLVPLLELQKSFCDAGRIEDVPGDVLSATSAVIDLARHRFWCRIESLKQNDDSPFLTLRAGILTSRGSFRVDATSGLYDFDFELIFRDVVNSLVLSEGVRYEKTGHLAYEVGHLRGWRLADPATSPAEKFGLIAGFLTDAGLSVGMFLSLIFIAANLLSKGRLKAMALRALESSPWGRRSRSVPSTLLPRMRLRRIPLPWAMVLQVAIALTVAIWLAPLHLEDPVADGYLLHSLCTCVGYGLVALAVGLHYLPNTGRGRKYELLTSALAVFSVPGIVVDPGNQAAIVGQQPSFVSANYLGNSLSHTIYFALAGWLAYLFLRRAGPGGDRTAERFYRFTHRFRTTPVLLVGLASFLPGGGVFSAGFVFLVARYVFGEKALENPVLYLRSFHDPNTATVLQKIVMREAGRLGPVLAVVHELQPGSELLRRTNTVDTTRLIVLPRADWQERLLAVLPHCRAVILDVSVASESLLWELAQAKVCLPTERILVLAHEDAAVDALDTPNLLRYRLGWREERKTRKALRQWIRKLKSAA